MVTYYYNKNKEIIVSDDTIKLTPNTFMPDGKLYELDSVLNFFNYCDNNKKINIIDIGAQTGLYTLYSKFLPNSQFYSFEPFPDSFNLLNENIRLNNISNVKTYNLAISNTTGNTKLSVCQSHNGLHTLGENPIRFSDTTYIEVATKTLDEIFMDIPLDMIKIDTEGWEYYILKGGYQVIKKYRPIIQLEYNLDNMKQCKVNPKEFMKYITDTLNYYVEKVIGEEMIIRPK